MCDDVQTFKYGSYHWNVSGHIWNIDFGIIFQTNLEFLGKDV
ncbi:unnamed protein product [marine sediment metagenome]|uniref:Uncharacterized protein n=1 Tax=marine sediment metagenome TaxID=412755 RepID=X0RYA3_9ZZZZ